MGVNFSISPKFVLLNFLYKIQQKYLYVLSNRKPFVILKKCFSIYFAYFYTLRLIWYYYNYVYVLFYLLILLSILFNAWMPRAQKQINLFLCVYHRIMKISFSKFLLIHKLAILFDIKEHSANIQFDKSVTMLNLLSCKIFTHLCMAVRLYLL